MNSIIRCDWANSDQRMQKYHDDEWGIPQHNDQKLFEMLTLECVPKLGYHGKLF